MKLVQLIGLEEDRQSTIRFKLKDVASTPYSLETGVYGILDGSVSDDSFSLIFYSSRQTSTTMLGIGSQRKILTPIQAALFLLGDEDTRQELDALPNEVQSRDFHRLRKDHEKVFQLWKDVEAYYD